MSSIYFLSHFVNIGCTIFKLSTCIKPADNLMQQRADFFNMVIIKPKLDVHLVISTDKPTYCNLGVSSCTSMCMIVFYVFSRYCFGLDVSFLPFASHIEEPSVMCRLNATISFSSRLVNK